MATVSLGLAFVSLLGPPEFIQVGFCAEYLKVLSMSRILDAKESRSAVLGRSDGAASVAHVACCPRVQWLFERCAL